jgi:hypothetical protein
LRIADCGLKNEGSNAGGMRNENQEPDGKKVRSNVVRSSECLILGILGI